MNEDAHGNQRGFFVRSCFKRAANSFHGMIDVGAGLSTMTAAPIATPRSRGAMLGARASRPRL